MSHKVLQLDVEVLKKRLQQLAILDTILCEEDWLRIYHYSYNERTLRAYCKIDNGSGDELEIIFSPDGAVIKGFDHESPYSPHAQEEYGIWPGMYDELPASLLEAVEEETEDIEAVTFCYWRESEQPSWNSGEYVRPEDMDDGTNFLLGYIHLSAEDHAEWAEGYYETTIDLPSVEAIFAGEAITDERIRMLNSERSLSEVRSELDLLLGI